MVWKYSLRENESGESMTDALHFTYVELSRFNKTEREVATFEEKLYFCLKHIHNLEKMPGSFMGDVLKKLFEAAEVAGMTEQQYKEYQTQ